MIDSFISGLLIIGMVVTSIATSAHLLMTNWLEAIICGVITLSWSTLCYTWFKENQIIRRNTERQLSKGTDQAGDATSV